MSAYPKVGQLELRVAAWWRSSILEGQEAPGRLERPIGVEPVEPPRAAISTLRACTMARSPGSGPPQGGEDRCAPGKARAVHHALTLPGTGSRGCSPNAGWATSVHPPDRNPQRTGTGSSSRAKVSNTSVSRLPFLRAEAHQGVTPTQRAPLLSEAMLSITRWASRPPTTPSASAGSPASSEAASQTADEMSGAGGHVWRV